MTGTLRFRDLNKGQPGRPACFGKEYDDSTYECRYSCSHKGACGPVFRARHGGSATPSGGNAVAPLPAEEDLPAVQEIDSAEETFFSKLAYNTGIQTLDALIRELHYAVRSVPRKRYFPQRDR
jgi:hypothetical protein